MINKFSYESSKVLIRTTCATLSHLTLSECIALTGRLGSPPLLSFISSFLLLILSPHVSFPLYDNDTQWAHYTNIVVKRYNNDTYSKIVYPSLSVCRHTHVHLWVCVSSKNGISCCVFFLFSLSVRFLSSQATGWCYIYTKTNASKHKYQLFQDEMLFQYTIEREGERCVWHEIYICIIIFFVVIFLLSLVRFTFPSWHDTIILLLFFSSSEKRDRERTRGEKCNKIK